MRFRFVTAGALALVLFATPVSAQPGGPSRDRAPRGDAMGLFDVEVSRAGVREQRPQAPAHAAIPDAATVAARVENRQADADGLAAVRGPDFAGDLDGDQRSDFIVADYDSGGERLELIGRRGFDGKRLWSKRLPGGYVHPMPVGAGGQGGAYVYKYPTDDDPWRFTAIGSNGAIAWQRDVAATPTSTPTSTGRVSAVYDFWFADVVKGPAVDLVLALWHYQDTPAGFLLTAEAQVIDGATGQIVTRFAETGLDTEPEVNVVGDIDGDGADDIAMAHYDYQGFGGVTLVSSATGVPLWRNPRVKLPFGGTEFASAGDLDGDGRDEVLMRYEQWVDDWTVSYSSQVLDGLSGTARFSAPGVAYELGDVDEDGSGELGAVEIIADDRYGVRSVVYNAAGEVVRRTDSTHAVPALYDGYIFAQTVGDVDADGVIDHEHAIYLYGESDEIIDTAVVSGRTGQGLWTDLRGSPLYANIDDGGDDFLLVEHDGWDEATDVTAVSGADGSDLWSTAAPEWYYPSDAADVNGDGGVDLLMIDSYTGDLLLLGSRDGAVVWRD